MDASRKPSIAIEVHASHECPHRLALLATSPVATGEAKQEEPRKGTERISSLPCQSGGSGQRHPITLRWRSCSWDVFPYDLLPNQLRLRACFLDRSAGGPRKRWRGRHGRKL